MNQTHAKSARTVSTLGLFAGPLVAIALLASPPPAELSANGWAAAAIGTLMAIWWMTEALPLAVTALVPLVLFPVLQISSFQGAAEHYSHPLIFLFLGGFLLARAMERWQLHRRIALNVMRLGGRTPGSIIASLMAATALLSMWVSNTATTMVMLPIGISMVGILQQAYGDGDTGNREKCAAALMLGIAYAATIGGMGTLIGTPPNALFAGFMQQTYGVTIGFAQWMAIGVPVVIILLPITWLILTKVAFRFDPPTHSGQIERAVKDDFTQAPMGHGEKRTAAVMALAALAWVFTPLIKMALPGIALSDAGIAVAAAVLLFLVPADWSNRRFLLTWDEAVTIRWDVLILFGGGLSLAAAISDTGLAQWIASWLAAIADLPRPLLLLIVMAAIVLLGEIASNTAMAAIFLPIAGAAAVGFGEGPLSLILPVVLAASLGFMLPVATPPNAIIFGSRAVTIRNMLRAGALLDVVSIAIVLVIVLWLGPLVFGT